jgi:hypothetical protein
LAEGFVGAANYIPGMSSTIPVEEPDVDVVREQRRRDVLRYVRARRASVTARRSAIARTAVLLRSIGYHDPH